IVLRRPPAVPRVGRGVPRLIAVRRAPARLIAVPALASPASLLLLLLLLLLLALVRRRRAARLEARYHAALDLAVDEALDRGEQRPVLRRDERDRLAGLA